ncbi:hypothetical protein KR009_003269 [Drosophila setifemur]|nr:hypothetical protein KR009_003269 [Drosophila setifemur]
MLKWAVNQPRNSYLANELAMGMETGSAAGLASGLGAGSAEGAAGGGGAGAAALPGSVTTSYSEFHTLRNKLKRKSLSLGLGLGKENQMTSTPLPAKSLPLLPRTPLLKDLSNILATPTSSGSGLGGAGAGMEAPSQKYACTLPTFDLEYSPTPSAAVIPGPLIALRGVGIPDSYFEKPRYLEQKPLPMAPPHTGAATSNLTALSSSQMGDVTLERMIDAILESNRKVTNVRPTRHNLRQRHRQHLLQRSTTTTSASASRSTSTSTSASRSTYRSTSASRSTYRPAFDPASDLCEYWRDAHPNPSGGQSFEEREVRSPRMGSGILNQQQLRRQRVVRRKRKITTKISSSVRQSAQKLLQRAVPHQKRRHISPDSGHNSTSDFEEELVTYGGGLAEAITKRRLSFSFSEDVFVEK